MEKTLFVEGKMVIRSLTEDLQKLANEKLNENEKDIENELKIFREWISQQAYLKSRTDDQFLIAFLRNCKYDLSQAQQKLINYYEGPQNNPDLLKRPKMEDERFRKLLKNGVVVNLPVPLRPLGPRVLLVRNGAFDPKEFTFAEVTQFRQLMQDILFLNDDIAVLSGIIYILDFGEVTASHYLQVSPSALKKVSQYLEEGVPLNLISNHFINTASGFASLYNLAKRFMPAKTQNKMFVYGANLEELYKIIPQDLLPQEYGGKAGNLQDLIDQWEQKVLSHLEYFKDNEKYRIDESLREKSLDTTTRSKFLGIF
ncbi:alpha-tocopherol transfer protein-like isoform 2-T2 [Cochliomyia hominivorax]